MNLFALLLVVGAGCTGSAIDPQPTPEPTLPEPEPACTWYVDADGDGFGDAATDPICDPPSTGYTLLAGDCDDTDPDINPSAVERCDEAQTDEDCNGLSDDDDDGRVGGIASWPDADGDGFGDSTAAPEGRCVVPADRSTDGTDCDDSDPHTFVGAAGFDDPFACMTDRDEDGWGSSTPQPGVQPGRDCDDTDVGFSPGVEDIFGDGIDQDCSGEDRWELYDGFEAGIPDPMVWAVQSGQVGGPGALGTPSDFIIFGDEMVTMPVDTSICDTLSWEVWVEFRDEFSNSASALTVQFHDGQRWVDLATFDEYPPAGYLRLGAPVNVPEAFRPGFQLRLFVDGNDIVRIDEFQLACGGPDGDGDGIGVLADCNDTDPRHWSDCATCIDNDGDGFGVDCNLGIDCNDANGDAFPGATEIAGNGIDEDCNGIDGPGFYDDFELGTLNGNVWQPVGANVQATDFWTHEGLYSMELQRDAVLESRDIDTSSCDRLYWSMWVSRRLTEANDRLEIAYFDGNDWVVTHRVRGHGSSDAWYVHHSGLIEDPSALGPHTRLQLRVIDGGTSFWPATFRIDDVTLQCAGPDDDGDGVPVDIDFDDSDPNAWTGPCPDGDGDGYGPGCDRGEDCDDQDPLISPLASDPFGDGIDTNCDGFDGVALVDSFELGHPDPSVWADMFETETRSTGGNTGLAYFDIGRDDYAETVTIDTSSCPVVVWAFAGRRSTPPPAFDNELVVSYWSGVGWVPTYRWPGKGTRDDFWSDHQGLLEGPDVSHPVFRMRWSVNDLSTRHYNVDDIVVVCSDPDIDGDGIAGAFDCAPNDSRHWADCGECLDVDGDGYGVDCDLGVDCLPTEPSVHPGADDPFGDGIDQDCSGADGVGWFEGFESAGPIGFWTYTQPVTYSHFDARTGLHSLEFESQGAIESIPLDTSECTELSWSFHTLRGFRPPELNEALVVSWFDGANWHELHRVPGGATDNNFVAHAGNLVDPAAFGTEFRLRFFLDATGSGFEDQISLDDVSLHCIP